MLVAALNVTGAVTTTEVLLWLFTQDQKSSLRLLTGAYLDGLSAAVRPTTKEDQPQQFCGFHDSSEVPSGLDNGLISDSLSRMFAFVDRMT